MEYCFGQAPVCRRHRQRSCQREAGEKGVTLAQHTAHLLIHGLLHLAGHDHVESEDQAAAMERLEIAALAKLDIADPYGDRD